MKVGKIGSIYDIPNENIKETLETLKNEGFEIIIVSTRCSTEEGQKEIRQWLMKYNLNEYIDKLSDIKPPALLYVDDRAYRHNPYIKNLAISIIGSGVSDNNLINAYTQMSNKQIIELYNEKVKLLKTMNTYFNKLYNPNKSKENQIMNLIVLDECISVYKKYLV